MRIVHVVGVRPNFMKVAPIMDAFEAHAGVEQVLVHTGQHHDAEMSRVFFDDLGLRRPDINLGLGPTFEGSATGRMMVGLRPALMDLRPDCVMVVGDADSAVAAALVAVRLGLPCVHVEAGLRSFDRSMPEEINRMVTDRISDLLLTPSRDADENLAAEGIQSDVIRRVGNVMIDTLLARLDRARERRVFEAHDLEPKSYALATFHRPSNVDDPATLEALLGSLDSVQRDVPIVLPLHPRTRLRLESFGLLERARALPNLRLIKPLGYLDILSLVDSSKFVLTDSGGLQEETTVLGIPCLTLRSCTERPVTVSIGTNTIVGSDPAVIRSEVDAILAGRAKQGSVPELWDGHASRRVASAVMDFLTSER